MNASEQVKDPRLTREAADWHARLRSQALSEVD